jgi:hypothetical protein
VRRADVKHDEERGLQVGRQGGDNSSKGLDASPRSSNDHNVSWGSCQASRTAFSIARLGSDHPVPALSKLIFSGRTPSFVSLLALLYCTGPAHEPSLCARLRRGQVPGDLRHHLAKFIRLLTRIAQNRCPHLVRQKIVERCPGAEAFGAPKFMGTGEPRSVKFDIGFGTILDHLTPSWQIAEVRPTETAQVGRPETMWPITTSLVATKIVSRVEALVTFLQFWSIRYGVDYVFYQPSSQNRKIGFKFYFHRCFWFPACVFQN